MGGLLRLVQRKEACMGGLRPRPVPSSLSTHQRPVYQLYYHSMFHCNCLCTRSQGNETCRWENNIPEYGVYKYLLVFHCNCVCISHRFWDIQHHIIAWPWNLGHGVFKVVENGAIRQIIYNFLLVGHCKYSFYFYRFPVIGRWIISWPWNVGYRSLKVIVGLSLFTFKQYV